MVKGSGYRRPFEGGTHGGIGDKEQTKMREPFFSHRSDTSFFQSKISCRAAGCCV